MKSVVTSWPTVPPPIPPPRQGEITQKNRFVWLAILRTCLAIFCRFYPKIKDCVYQRHLEEWNKKKGWEGRRLLDQKQSIRIYLQPHSNHCQKNRTIWWLLLQDNWFRLIFNCCNFYGCCIYTFLWTLVVNISIYARCRLFIYLIYH